MESRSCFGNHELLENILQCLGPDSVLEDVNKDARRVAEAVRWRSSRDFSYRPNSPRTCWLDPVTDALTAAPTPAKAQTWFEGYPRPEAPTRLAAFVEKLAAGANGCPGIPREMIAVWSFDNLRRPLRASSAMNFDTEDGVGPNTNEAQICWYYQTVELLQRSGLSSTRLRKYYYVFDIHFLRCPVSIHGRRLTQLEIWAYVDRMVAEAGLDPDEIREEYHAIIKLTLKEGSIDEQAFFPVGDAARAWAKKFLSGKKLGEKLAHPEAVINAGVEAKAIAEDPEDTKRIWNVPSGARFASSDRAASQILSLLARRRVLPRVQTVASLGPPQRAPPRRLSARSTCSFTRRTRAPSTRSARSGGDASRRCRS